MTPIRTALTLALAASLAAVSFAQSVTHLTGEGPWRIEDSIRNRGWKYYSLDVQGQHGEIKLNFAKRQGQIDVFLKQGSIPTQANFDTFNSYNTNGVGGDTFLRNTTPVKLVNGRAYFGIFTRTACAYNIIISRNVLPSHIAGMGSIPTPEGTSFRTYSPFATSIHAAGDFNGWNSLAAPLQNENNDYKSVFIRGATPGQKYKFVIRNGGQTLWRVDPYSQRLTNSVGDSVIYDRNAFNWNAPNYSTPSWNNTVIYQMHIGTFNDLPGGAPGNFNSAIQRLDYLQELGITAIKLLPVNEFAGDYSWGYNPGHPFAIESAYGGPDAFKNFINEAHKRGIAVLLDIVHNHYGPSDLSLWQFDGWSQNGRGGLFFYNDDRAITPWGDTRPDYGRGFVRQYIRDNAITFLEEYRLDGFRWDSTLNIRVTNQGDNGDGWSLMQWINEEINARQPWKLSIAEDLQSNPWITKTVGEGGAGFDSQWSPNFVHPMRPLMTAPSDGDRNMNDLVTALTQNYNGQWLQRVIYTESHDEVANGRSRVPQEIDPGNPGSYWARKRSTLGAVVTMTTPGIPMIFQGQEILEDGFFQDTDPIDWSKANTFAGVRQLYKDLIGLRLNKNGTTKGLSGPNLNLFHVNNGAKVAAYHRWDQGGAGDDTVVLVNFSNTSFSNYTIGLPRPGNWSVAFNSDWNGYGSDYNNTFTAGVTAQSNPLHGLNYRGTFALGPYSAVILTLNPASGSVLSSGKTGRTIRPIQQGKPDKF